MYFFKFSIFLIISIKLYITEEIKENHNDELYILNLTEYKNLCNDEKKNYNINDCHKKTLQYEKMIKEDLLTNYFYFENNEIKFSQKFNLTEFKRKTISYVYYYLGFLHYYGYLTKEPDLENGLANFLISSYFGGAEAKYIIYLLLSNNIFEEIIQEKEFEKIIENNKLISMITKTGYYKNNFKKLIESINNQTEDKTIKGEVKQKKYEKIENFRNTLSISFLYSSAIQNYSPAKKILAYKLWKGYGVDYSCTNAVKYYIELAKENLEKLSKYNKKIYYDFRTIDKYEYIGKKYNKDNSRDAKSIVELYWNVITNKKEATNTELILELAKMYYYGSTGVEQNFNTSFMLFSKGYKLNNNESMYYLGEQYLNGWGVEQNYEKALDMFKASVEYVNNSRSWNSLGYMYYYGLGVKKDIKKAKEYFQNGAENEDFDSFYDLSYLLIENQKNDENKIKVDYKKAYDYASKASHTHTHSFGNYLFAMMNQYSIGSMVKTCNLNIEFFKSATDYSLYIKKKFDLAMSHYLKHSYRKSFLLFLELSEMGIDKAQINLALLLKYYNILKNKKLQNYLTYKYFLISSDSKNSLAQIYLGDIFFKGFGNLKPNLKKSREYYKSVNLMGNKLVVDTFPLAHSTFSLGLSYILRSKEKNDTQKLIDIERGFKLINSTIVYEPYTFYLCHLIKIYYNLFLKDDANFISSIKKVFLNTLKNFLTLKTLKSWKFIFILVSILLYALFFLSLKNQKD